MLDKKYLYFSLGAGRPSYSISRTFPAVHSPAHFVNSSCIIPSESCSLSDPIKGIHLGSFGENIYFSLIAGGPTNKQYLYFSLRAGRPSYSISRTFPAVHSLAHFVNSSCIITSETSYLAYPIMGIHVNSSCIITSETCSSGSTSY
ncbi:MAG: hypothetical protein QOE33_3766 [Acidobacteriota bacterium]|nr:hypothetical protein [Acidobacteriota bacterium]